MGFPNEIWRVTLTRIHWERLEQSWADRVTTYEVPNWREQKVSIFSARIFRLRMLDYFSRLLNILDFFSFGIIKIIFPFSSQPKYSTLFGKWFSNLRLRCSRILDRTPYVYSLLPVRIIMLLSLINGAGGLCGRILTEVVKYRPNAVRSVLTTEFKILPCRPTKLG